MKRRQFIAGLSGAVAWQLAARAQQPGTFPVIGFLSGRGAGEATYLVEAFNTGLNDVGFRDGENVSVVYRWGEGRNERLPPLALAIMANVDHPAAVLELNEVKDVAHKLGLEAQVLEIRHAED